MLAACLLVIAATAARTWDLAAYDAYRAYEAGDPKKAAELNMEAGRLAKTDPELFFYTSAGWYASAGESDRAIDALEAAIAAGFVDSQHLASDPTLRRLRANPRWTEMFNTLVYQERALERTLTNPGLRRELLAMWSGDQQARIAQKAVDEVDARNQARMKEIVASFGWPAISAVGRDGSRAAWALVQHADDVAFQLRVLGLMQELMKKGEARAQEYAELHDRIRRNQRRRQTYGMATQDGAFHPIEDEGNLERRRRALGLEPAPAYARLHGFQYTPLTVAAAKQRDARDAKNARELLRASNEHFAAGRYTEAREQLAAAIRLGIVSDRDLRDAAKRFLPVPEHRDAAFLYLRILCYRGALQKSDVPDAEITDRHLRDCIAERRRPSG